MNCLIVDDNMIARTTMRQLVSYTPGIAVLAECSSAIEAYHIIKAQQVDILLLDIEMPGMSGIELARQLTPNKPVIIFTTSKNDYAVDAFELNVADYVVKPVTPARFIQAIERATDLLESNRQEVKTDKDAVIFIRDSNIVRRLLLNDIQYIEAMGDYVKIFTPQKYYAIHSTLKILETKLPAEKFFRTHRSYIIAINKIDSIQEGIILINGKSIPVSDSYKAALTKRLDIL